MKSKVFKIEPNGQCGFEFVEGTEKIPIGLEALQKAVDGFVQCINLHYMGLPDIDLWLNEEGKIHGLPLNPIATLLSRLYKYGDVITPDGIPAIIDKELFERVQMRMAANKKAPARAKAEEEYLLTTKLYCGDCGRLMAGESGKGCKGIVYHYYCAVNDRERFIALATSEPVR